MLTSTSMFADNYHDGFSQKQTRSHSPVLIVFTKLRPLRPCRYIPFAWPPKSHDRSRESSSPKYFGLNASFLFFQFWEFSPGKCESFPFNNQTFAFVECHQNFAMEKTFFNCRGYFNVGMSVVLGISRLRHTRRTIHWASPPPFPPGDKRRGLLSELVFDPETSGFRAHSLN